MSFAWSASDDVFQLPLGADLQPGQRLGTWRILERVGAGGMGVVYRAFDDTLNREVALKLLLSGRAASQAQRERFRREAEALARVRHPLLLQVFSAGEQSSVLYLVTEWLAGRTLSERLAAGPLPVDEAIEIVHDLAEALAHAHARGVLHRDVKPSNVLLVPRRGPVLIDFGLAKGEDLGDSLTRSGVFAGTAGYAAPEQLVNAKHVDERADVYALGALLYALLTGAPPGGEATSLSELIAVVTRGGTPPPSRLRSELPPGLDAVVLRALAPDRDQRLPSAEALAELLTPQGLAGAGRSRGLRRLGQGALGLALLAGAASAGFYGSTLTAPPATPVPPATPAPAPSASPSFDAEAARAARLAAERAEAERSAAVQALVAEPFRGTQDLAARRERWAQLPDPIPRWREALAQAEPPARAELRWRLGVALADAGDAAGARATLAGITDEALRARVALTLAGLPEPGGAPTTREALARALAAGAASEVAAEELAGALAGLALEGNPDPARLRELLARTAARDGAPPWAVRAAWLLLVEREPSPGWPALGWEPPWASARFARALLPRWEEALPPVGLRALELGSEWLAEIQRFSLCNAAVGQGRLETVRRLRERIPSRHHQRAWERAREAAAQLAGPIKGDLKQGWACYINPPHEQRAHFLFSVPDDAVCWELRLRGAVADLDLRVRHDAPPAEGEGRTARSLAADETLRVRGEGLTTGVHQVWIERPSPWPGPIEVAVEARFWRGGEQPSPWRPTSDLTPNLSEEARELVRAARVAKSREELRRRISELSPQIAQWPDLALVRAHLLADAQAWEALLRLPLPPAPAQLRWEVRWLQARAAAQLQRPEAAELLAELLAEAPDRLEVREDLALLRLGEDPAGARQLLEHESAREQEPSALALRFLADAWERGQDFEALRAALETKTLQGHPRARHLVLRAMLRHGRPEWVVPFLETVGFREPWPDRLYRWRALRACGEDGRAQALRERCLADAPPLGFQRAFSR